ncbi:MAG: hypothetical protein IJU04_00590 [Ruminococcus sp.]|nr:hypothetical protein [Ruminococcus sp.]
MKALKSALLSIMLIVTIISVCSCGGEPVKTSLNYERPVITMARAVDSMDSESYLNCFTDGAKLKYMKSDNYNPDLVNTMLPSQADNKRLFKAKVVSAQSLDKNAITELQKDYVAQYKKRISITKAQKMTVEFGTIQGNTEQIDRRELTAVRIENEWFIYGDVIEEFDFGKDKKDSKTAS